MNKAQPWNINGVGFDAREAAREAARRQGKSLGEWLHGVIADHAEDNGVAPRALGGQERIDAVTARLEQLGARPGADHARRAPPRGRPDPRGRTRRAAEERDDEDFFEDSAYEPRTFPQTDERSARRAVPDRDDGADLLESAVAAMERRASRAERRTNEALAAMAKLLEETQARREQEHGDVAVLTRKLAELETNLTQQFAASAESPVKGSLARLEARLDAIGRRGAAEAVARQSAAAPKPPQDAEPIRRLEEKLDTLLETMQPRRAPAQQASTAAIAAVQAAPAPGRRSLGDAIADISRRQRSLEGSDETGVVTARASGGASRRPDAAEALVASLRGEMLALGAKVDDIRRDALLSRQSRPSRDGDLDAMRAEIGTISRTLGDLAPRGSIDALETSIATLGDRIGASREHGIRESLLRPVEAALGDLRQSMHVLDPRETIGGLEEEMRRIGTKVDGLADHDGSGILHLQRQMEELRDAVTAMAARPQPVERIERQVALLAERLDRRLDQPATGPDLQGEIAAAADALRDMVRGAPAHLEKIEGRLDKLAGRLDQALAVDHRAAGAGLQREIGAAADAMRSMVGGAPAHLEKIESRLEMLADRLDRVLAADHRVTPAQVESAQLEQIVRDLGLRLEAAQAPGADTAALDQLQQQVEQLSERFERSETELSALPTLAASMGELFAHLEATRDSVETSAAEAAREVLRSDEGRRAASPDPAALRALHDAAEARTSSTLNTVHDMLGKVVNRLSVMEHDIQEVRQRPEPAFTVPSASAEAQAPGSIRPKTPTARPALGESREIRLGGMEPRSGAPSKPARKAEAPPAVAPTGIEDRRADFIAAARRAAATAQAETAAAQRKLPTDKLARAGLLARSRDYVASHKRPVLMGIAAIMMALGAIALASRLGPLSGGVELASAPFKRLAVSAPAAPIKLAASAPASLDPGAMTPSALPKSTAPLANPIPGSDPIQTGSIPSLPSFAAGPALPPPRPIVSRALMAAADAGDVAAQYELASVYADGRVVPRDMKLAATWFDKAAAAGSAPARYRLASLYEKGISVPLDKARAKSLYTEAADAGNPRAMHNLAVLLADGDGHPDYPGAVAWFRKAAQYGVHDSQYNLAVLLGRGLGAPQNLVQSYQWFAVAAAAADSDAEKKRDEVGTKLSANDLAVAKALAAAFQPKIADPAVVEVKAPPGGWDGAPGASRLNSARSKISSL